MVIIDGHSMGVVRIIILLYKGYIQSSENLAIICIILLIFVNITM